MIKGTLVVGKHGWVGQDTARCPRCGRRLTDRGGGRKTDLCKSCLDLTEIDDFEREVWRNA